MSIYQNGKLLTKEQAFDTNVDNRWKQLPTGFRVDASGKSIASFEQFVLFSDEQFWGFGEKFTHFNKRGQRIECWQKMHCLLIRRIHIKVIRILQAAGDIQYC